MSRYEVVVEISHLPGVADPQGATVERALPSLGYTNVSELRIARTIRLVIETDSAAAAQREVTEMCEKILANPVIEAYAVTVREAADS